MRLLHMDGTYKLNYHGFPCILLGTSDWTRRYFPGVYAFFKTEKEESFLIIAKAIENYLKLHHKEKHTSLKIFITISDAHPSYRKAYQKIVYYEKVWKKILYSRADLPGDFLRTNNAVENHNRHFKLFTTKGRRPSLFDTAIKMLKKVSVISQEQTQAPWNET